MGASALPAPPSALSTSDSAIETSRRNLLPYHVLPNHLRPDAVPERLDVHAHLAQRRAKLIRAHVVVLRHALEHLGHILLVGRNAELPRLLDLQTLLDEHVGGLLLQGRGGLFLGGDGEEALALLDVVDGDGIVVDEHDDRLLDLRPSRRSNAEQRSPKRQASRSPQCMCTGSRSNTPPLLKAVLAPVGGRTRASAF